jgi:phosphate transport system protein
LQGTIGKMGTMVREAIRRLAEAIDSHNTADLARLLIDDRRIDALENLVDDQVVTFLAIHQPVADQLRLVMSILQVSNELERMGDHTKSVAKCLLAIDFHSSFDGYLRDFAGVVRQVEGMVGESLLALEHRDLVLAEQVRAQDKQVDAFCDQDLGFLVQRLKTEPELAEKLLQAAHAVRRLERIADLSTNVAKEVIFLVRGKTAKHGGVMPDTDTIHR